MKNKKLKKILILMGIILSTAAISGGIYLLGKVDKKEDNKINDKNDKNDTLEETIKDISIVDLNSKTRPYAIMINNLGTARPLQSGLQDAYIIYELIVEGGLTRYMALFLDQETSRIGSIRSARHYYLDYALENDAIYVHHGQSPQASEDFSDLNVTRITVNESTTGWRDSKLKKEGYASEHTLFTSMEKLSTGLKNKRTERNKDLLLDYSAEEIDLSSHDGAAPASSVLVKYSNSVKSSYEYDEENKVYKRFVNNKEHKDYVTKKQYTFKNIITYQVKNTTIDSEGRQDLDTVGNGTGYYISNGYAVPITWSKSSRESQTIYKFKNGEELKVNDGNTFIQIQPKGQELTIK